MPVHLAYRGGKRPWKIVERDGTIVGSSTNKPDADASARARNAAFSRKKK